ncbi:MAG: hypothetical protein JWO33_1659, partial [Caulobacteraceae bacterium]|nr:hypothetical protein [Caulobacteraceae bacterium]
MGALVRPASLVRLILAAAFLVMLGANLPGHLSYDSVAQLHEGHFGVRETWQPVLYARLLGAFDAVVPGTGLYVVAASLLLFLCLASLAALRDRTSWLAVPVTIAALVTPQLFIYQAIVWKDVMFANAAVAGMVCLANAARAWATPSRWAWLAGAALMLAVAGLVRQNGLIVTVFAAIALGWIAGQGGWRRGLAWAAAGFVVVLALAQVLNATAQLPSKGPQAGLGQGLRIVQQYDLVAATALDRSYGLPTLTRANPTAAAVIRERAYDYYSPERIDFIDRDVAIQAALNALPDAAVREEWLGLVLKHPGLYLRIRADDFRWVFLTPVVDRCLSNYVGVAAPDKMLRDLGQQPRWTDADQQLANYWTWFLDTPAYS